METKCITREQLANIFAAREEMHQAMVRLEGVFTTGKIDQVGARGGTRARGWGETVAGPPLAWPQRLCAPAAEIFEGVGAGLAGSARGLTSAGHLSRTHAGHTRGCRRA